MTSQNNYIPAYVPPPGEVILMELEARGWTAQQLAAMMGQPSQLIDELLKGTTAITSLVAHQLANVFGTSSELWHNLEVNYQRHMARQAHQRDLTLFTMPTMPTHQWTEALAVSAD